MGQYFRAVITTANMKKVESWFLCYDYGDGAKLTEHAYIGNDYVSAVESRLAEKPGHVVWAGDYGDLKLYDKCSTIKKVDPAKYPATERTGRFLINHSAKEFVDKEKVPAYDDGWKLHPLPLLTANGNGEGGGDFYGEDIFNLVGSWAGDLIGVADEVPEGYDELVFDLVEEF